ncbi:MAG: T9SS type A sorting domain-containing protein [Bacteroidia bacterium]|nr:T9SS type A sorting domain-containing protein [Bacteroidia bacterium]
MIVYNNDLYFSAGSSNNELWKTDGSTTVKVATCNFEKAYLFNNLIVFTAGSDLWKSDGTTQGTVLVKSAVGQITGGNSDYFYTSKIKSMPAPDYMGYDYWRSDATTDGTVQVSTKLGNATSFVVLNNKMFYTYGATGLWETDGTETGTTSIITGYTGIPFVFNNTIFFSKTATATGIELWSYTPGAVTAISKKNSSKNILEIYPNPASGIVKIAWDGNPDASLRVFNQLGCELTLQKRSNYIDFTNQQKGIYLVKMSDGDKTYTEKIVIK